MNDQRNKPVRATREALTDRGAGGPVTHWRMRDGSPVLICEMSDEHLIKVIRRLEINHKERSRFLPIVELACSVAAYTTGEDTFVGWKNLRDNPTYQAVTQEARQRDLDFGDRLN